MNTQTHETAEVKELKEKTKEELIELLIIERQSNAMYKSNLSIYEQNGLAKLYYSLNRKMNEAADMLNKNKLQDVELDDKNNKAFERIVKILEASEKMATSVNTLGALAKVTGNEKEDVERKPFVNTIAEDRK